MSRHLLKIGKTPSWNSSASVPQQRLDNLKQRVVNKIGDTANLNEQSVGSAEVVTDLGVDNPTRLELGDGMLIYASAQVT